MTDTGVQKCYENVLREHLELKDKYTGQQSDDHKVAAANALNHEHGVACTQNGRIYAQSFTKKQRKLGKQNMTQT